jgi:hypothetical protein
MSPVKLQKIPALDAENLSSVAVSDLRACQTVQDVVRNIPNI